MHFERVYYPDHAERYKHMSARQRREFPDELVFRDGYRIKREKNFKDMTQEDWDKYGADEISFAAKDVSVDSCLKSYYP